MNIKFPKIKGAEFFLCGGVVRDLLLEKKPKDLDFIVLTELSFNQLVKEIEKVGIVFMAKPEFLIIRAKIDNQIIDIAFPRRESGYLDGRHPTKVNRVKTLMEDASRRDFTINSMFMGESGAIIDYFNGQKDLKDKWIKAVGNPDERFKEDYLRILRAMRFSIRLNAEIEYTTLTSLRKNVKGLKVISIDRIKEELNKMLKIDPSLTINMLHKTGVLDIIKERGLRFQVTNKKKVKMK